MKMTPGWWKEYLPAAGMVEIQVTAALMTLLSRAALVKGMSPRVFIFYRQATATLFIFPIFLFFSRKKGTNCLIGARSFLLIFALSLIGVTMNQNLLFEGIYLTSSSTASAMSNLVPAVTFLIALLLGLEKINIKRWSSRAKILGTIVCVGGAASITLLKGPTLFGATWLHQGDLRLVELEYTWLLGCLFLFGNSITWSIWLILQVPATASCPDHLSISAWTCLLSTMESGLVALISESDWEAWNMSSALEISCILWSGIICSGVQYIIQAWCISTKGPLYSAMFNPLSTVIVTILASIFLHEHIYVGSLMGSIAVIVGLYVVLWGKSKEIQETNVIPYPMQIEEAFTGNLEQPLLQCVDN